MAMTNQELIAKAEITSAQLAAAGKLNPKQADRFIDFVINVTELSNVARIARFRNEETNIDKIGVGKRSAVPKVEATDPGVRRTVNHTKVTLKPQAIMVPWEIGDIYSEINIEGESVQDTIIRLMATQVGNDLEELYINGNALGAAVIEDDILDGGSTTLYVKDTFLALFDGWLELAESGFIHDATGNPVTSSLFSEMIKAMPDKFKRTRKNMRFVAATDAEQEYRQTVSSRATAAGDVALSTTMNLTPFGIQLVGVPLLSERPKRVEHFDVVSTAQVLQLQRTDLVDVVVTLQSLAGTPTAKLVEGVDYTVQAIAGTVTVLAPQDTADLKITYTAGTELMLTPMDNMIIGIGRDIRIEKDRDIFKTVNQYAITVKAAVEFEEITAVVKAINVGI